MNILKQIKRITHDHSVCSLNTKSFYHGVILAYTNWQVILTSFTKFLLFCKTGIKFLRKWYGGFHFQRISST